MNNPPADDTALTRRQRDVLAALREREREGLPPPSLDTLCAALGVRSRGSLHKHVEALRAAGLVAPSEGLNRGIRLRPEARPAPSASGRALPLLGHIAAGRPIEAVSAPETLDIPGWLCAGDDDYVLRVRGDSMIDDGILDGDWVVIRHRDHARDGEVVVALIDAHEATLKRIEQRPDACILHPANGALSPMTYAPDRVTIQGVLVAQIRRY